MGLGKYEVSQKDPESPFLKYLSPIIVLCGIVYSTAIKDNTLDRVDLTTKRIEASLGSHLIEHAGDKASMLARLKALEEKKAIKNELYYSEK